MFRGWTLPLLRQHLRYILPVAAIVLTAIAVREVPGSLNAAWGNDFGIYLGLTERMLETGELFPAYDGWGVGYQYFPTFYLLSAGTHLLTGADLVWLMPKVAGVVGGLTVLFLYFVAMELFKDRRVALLAALILALDPVHIYQTSHPAPLTMGHLALMASLLFFLRWRRGASWIPLAAAATLLIASHHLSTYFFILAVTGASIGTRLLGDSDDRQFRRDLSFVAAFALGAFAYWGLVATPMWAQIRIAAGIPALGVVLLFFLTLLLWHRYARGLLARLQRPLRWLRTVRPRYAAAATFAFCYGMVLLNVFVAPWGRAFQLEASALLLLLPPILLLSFAAGGFAFGMREARWGIPIGILLAFLASILVGFVTRNTAIISYRHLEYIAIPSSLFAAKGILAWEQRLRELVLSGWKTLREARARWMNAGASAAMLAVLATNAWSGFAAVNGSLGFDERIPDVTLDMMDWMAGNLPPDALVAADHRVSQLLWAHDLNATNDMASEIYTAKTWWKSVEELSSFQESTGAYVTYVFLDYIMIESGIQSGTEATPLQLTPESYAKFSKEPFALVHRLESDDGTRWAEVYSVDWAWIAPRGTR